MRCQVYSRRIDFVITCFIDNDSVMTAERSAPVSSTWEWTGPGLGRINDAGRCGGQ